MKVEIIDSKGKKTGKKAELSDSVWGVPMNTDLIAQVVKVYRANQRKGTAQSKTRSDVSGGGRKPWKQKGTGRARHGSTRSPLWVKGGVTFGPQSYKKFFRIPKKMNKLALKCMLSEKARTGNLFIVDDIKISKERLSNNVNDFVTGITSLPKALVVFSKEAEAYDLCKNGARNLAGLKVKKVSYVNVYDVIDTGSVIIDSTSIKELEERLS